MEISVRLACLLDSFKSCFITLVLYAQISQRGTLSRGAQRLPRFLFFLSCSWGQIPYYVGSTWSDKNVTERQQLIQGLYSGTAVFDMNITKTIKRQRMCCLSGKKNNGTGCTIMKSCVCVGVGCCFWKTSCLNFKLSSGIGRDLVQGLSTTIVRYI